MRQIDHPNIVQLVDFSESRQYYYIILELCPGGELFHQIVRLTYFSEDLSRHVIVQVAQALEYLHEVGGVVHRYVNILGLKAQEPTNMLEAISNRRIFCFTRPRSFRRRTRSQSPPRMKTRKMRVNLSQASELVELEKSRLQILAYPKSSGIVKP